MQMLAPGWNFSLERGPDWLFVRLNGPQDGDAAGANLAEKLWGLLQQQFTYRLVLELDELAVLRSHLIGQLVLLHQRIDSHGGLLRLCGLSEENQLALRASRLDACFPLYRDREEAVMGHRPNRPR